ncbi:MAG TPA: NUDIX hydrolase [Candidatus Saccharimonadales bacterium]|nr:NUDIX hydrolase [Candidatus Saccharimonadales bacterium]
MRLFKKKKTYESFIAWSKTLDRRVSSAAMILENSAGQVLIVKAGYKSYWTFPGGIIDAGETPKEAAIREVFEEVGITVDPSTVDFVAVVNRKSNLAQTYQFIFKTTLTKTMLEHLVLQASELEDYALITKADVTRENRPYGKVIHTWATGAIGYVEQLFDRRTDG